MTVPLALPLIRRILADLKGLKKVSVDLTRSNNKLCFAYINEGGRKGNMALVSHGVAEDPQKVLTLDMRPWVRPARVVPPRPVPKPVAVAARPIPVSIPRRVGFMERLAGWIEDFAEDLG